MSAQRWLLRSRRQQFSVSYRRYATLPVQTIPPEIPPPRLDIRGILNNVESKSRNIQLRRAPVPSDAIHCIADLYAEQRDVDSQVNASRHRRSILGDKIRGSTKDPIALKSAVQEATELKAKLKELETKQLKITTQISALAQKIPNDTHPDVPLGPEPCAKVLSTHGPRPLPALPERDHLAIARKLGLVDFEAGAVTTGTSWYYLVGEGALLEMALVNYALSIAMKHGFKPVTTPDVVRTDLAYRCGFQPRDREEDKVSQMYHVSNTLPDASQPPRHPELVLAGTAEIPLAGMFANRAILPSTLPHKVVGLGRAFRAEAGARGVMTRGLFRVHQFTKLELFAVTLPNASEAMMEDFKQLQIELLESLGLTFRVLDMPTEQLGASAYRKYDIEAWMPGRGDWGEVSSTSNCTDYQARRLHIRASEKIKGQGDNDNLLFLHTLNGTAVAVPRLIVALLENGACFNSTGEVEAITLPNVLKPFWVGDLGRDIIRWQ